MSREGTEEHARPLERPDDLLDIFEKGARPRPNFHIGLESEKLGVFVDSALPIPFEGDRGIEAILKAIANRNGWECIEDEGRTISLQKGATAITLEPGGQLELSSRPHPNLESLARELHEHGDEVCSVSRPLGITWLNLGIQPMARLSEVPPVPKSRYHIMKNYYAKALGVPLEMMMMTASIQGNFDYENEADLRKKIHVGAALGPVVGAMMANSAVEKGKLNGYCSRRLQVWQHTDGDRCGIVPFFVDGSFSYEQYRDYALRVPMYFVIRNGQYVDMTGRTFADFFNGNHSDVGPPRTNDWESHLTTLFPDVRLKNHLEFRTADANDSRLTLALIAFWHGIVQDSDTLDAVFRRLRRHSFDAIVSAMGEAATRGLQGRMGEEPLWRLAQDVVSLAAVGLTRLDRQNGRHDISYLEPLRNLVDRRESPAERLRRRWKGCFKQLIRICA